MGMHGVSTDASTSSIAAIGETACEDSKRHGLRKSVQCLQTLEKFGKNLVAALGGAWIMCSYGRSCPKKPMSIFPFEITLIDDIDGHVTLKRVLLGGKHIVTSYLCSVSEMFVSCAMQYCFWHNSFRTFSFKGQIQK